MCTFEVFSNAEGGGDVRNILFRVLNPNSISSFDVDDAFTSCLISFSRRRVTTQNFRIAFEKKEKRREALATPLPLSRRGSLSHSSGRRVCVCLSVVSEKEKERKREIFDPQNNKSEIIHKKNEYIKNNDDDKRAPMPAKRRRGCKQQTSKREQRQMQQQ